MFSCRQGGKVFGGRPGRQIFLAAQTRSAKLDAS